MSQKRKHQSWNPVQKPLPGMMAFAGVPEKESAQVRRLIAQGNSGYAVDVAKQVHRRCANSVSEALLVDAYAARISSLAERNLDRRRILRTDA